MIKKITYEPEMQLNELVDSTMDKIEELKQGLQDNKNESVCDAIQEIIEAEKEALSYVLDGLTKH